MLASASDPPYPADCLADSTFRYQRREPERTLLHRIVPENLATFLCEAADRYPSGEMPAFIAEEFSRYLRCGILSHGFARVRCPSCRDELLVALACASSAARCLSSWAGPVSDARSEAAGGPRAPMGGEVESPTPA